MRMKCRLKQFFKIKKKGEPIRVKYLSLVYLCILLFNKYNIFLSMVNITAFAIMCDRHRDE